jgi:hypothetical protein
MAVVGRLCPVSVVYSTSFSSEDNNKLRWSGNGVVANQMPKKGTPTMLAQTHTADWTPSQDSFVRALNRIGNQAQIAKARADATKEGPPIKPPPTPTQSSHPSDSSSTHSALRKIAGLELPLVLNYFQALVIPAMNSTASKTSPIESHSSPKHDLNF